MNKEPYPWTWAGNVLSIRARALVVGTESVWGGAANERDKGGGVGKRMGQDPGANAGIDRGSAADVPGDGGAGRGRRARGVAWLALWMCLAVAALPGVSGVCQAYGAEQNNEDKKTKCDGGTPAETRTFSGNALAKQEQCVNLCCATLGCTSYQRKQGSGECIVAPNPPTPSNLQPQTTNP